MNNTLIENVSLVDAKKQVERCKDKLSLVIVKNALNLSRTSHTQYLDHTGTLYIHVLHTCLSGFSYSSRMIFLFRFINRHFFLDYGTARAQDNKNLSPQYATKPDNMENSKRASSLKPLSFTELDRPATPIEGNTERGRSTDGPIWPPPANTGEMHSYFMVVSFS